MCSGCNQKTFHKMCSIIILGMHGWLTAIRLSAVHTTVYHCNVLRVHRVERRFHSAPIPNSCLLFHKKKQKRNAACNTVDVRWYFLPFIQCDQIASKLSSFHVLPQQSDAGKSSVNNRFHLEIRVATHFTRSNHSSRICHVHAPSTKWWYNMFNFRPTIKPPLQSDTNTQKNQHRSAIRLNFDVMWLSFAIAVSVAAAVANYFGHVLVQARVSHTHTHHHIENESLESTSATSLVNTLIYFWANAINIKLKSMTKIKCKRIKTATTSLETAQNETKKRSQRFHSCFKRQTLSSMRDVITIDLLMELKRCANWQSLSRRPHGTHHIYAMICPTRNFITRYCHIRYLRFVNILCCVRHIQRAIRRQIEEQAEAKYAQLQLCKNCQSVVERRREVNDGDGDSLTHFHSVAVAALF